jgi:hypothetical protein
MPVHGALAVGLLAQFGLDLFLAGHVVGVTEI